MAVTLFGLGRVSGLGAAVAGLVQSGQTVARSAPRVEFAILLPRLSDGHSEVFLPIDAKFPHESFERIVAAADSGTPAELEEAAHTLERTIHAQAKDIASKYIVPLHTTD